ncbi:hypothetical protein D3C87_1945900 [compost metagenome]
MPEPDAVTPGIPYLTDPVAALNVQRPTVKRGADRAQSSHFGIQIRDGPIHYGACRATADFFIRLHYFQRNTSHVEVAVIIGSRVYLYCRYKGTGIPLSGGTPIGHMK